MNTTRCNCGVEIIWAYNLKTDKRIPVDTYPYAELETAGQAAFDMESME